MILDERPLPLVLAPLAGGPSTPRLTAAVTDAGGLGTLAFGYLSTSDAAERLTATRGLTSGPFGVNVFVPGTPYADRAALDRFGDRLLADPLVPTGPGEASTTTTRSSRRSTCWSPSRWPPSRSRSGCRRLPR